MSLVATDPWGENGSDPPLAHKAKMSLSSPQPDPSPAHPAGDLPHTSSRTWPPQPPAQPPRQPHSAPQNTMATAFHYRSAVATTFYHPQHRGNHSLLTTVLRSHIPLPTAEWPAQPANRSDMATTLSQPRCHGNHLPQQVPYLVLQPKPITT